MVDGKRNLLALLVEKTVEYLKQCDVSCGLVMQEITSQLDSIIKTLVDLVDETQAAGGRTDRSRQSHSKHWTAISNEFHEKDAEIAQLMVDLKASEIKEQHK